VRVSFKKKFSFCKAKALSEDENEEEREAELGLIEKEMEKIQKNNKSAFHLDSVFYDRLTLDHQK